MKKYFLLIVLLVYSFLILHFSHEIAENIIKSISICIDVIIPSLFAFMVVSGIIIKSGVYKILGKPFERIANKLFGISGELFSIFIISSVAGYPIGAKLIKNLYLSGEVDKITAEKMLCYCYLGGPAFFLGLIGNRVFGNAKIGLVIFLAIFTTNILLGIIFRDRKFISLKKKKEISVNISFNDIIDSINSGGLELIKICGIIVFFGTIITILDCLGFNTFIADFISKISNLSFNDSSVLLKSIYDITNISNITPKIELIPIITSLLSFGGICVIFQVEGIISGTLSRRKFYLSRVISLVISYLLALLYMKLFNVEDLYIQTFLNNLVKTHHFSPFPFLMLLILTIFVISSNTKNIVAK